MKKIVIISGAAALMLVVATVFAADKKPATLADAQAKIADLTKQVDSLQDKIKGLEERMARLEKQPPIVSLAPSLTPVPNLPAFLVPGVKPDLNFLEGGFADPAHPPKIWGEGECNGWKFYTIPLLAAERASAIPIPLATGAAVSR